MKRHLPVLLAGLLPVAVTAASLNDTGSTICTDGGTVYTTCTTLLDNGSSLPHQDARYGVSAMDNAGVYYSKQGGSATKGRDYSKVCNSGEPAGTGACPAAPVLGVAANEWGCTKDNVTGLTWEMKVNNSASLHHKNWYFSWYDSNPATNGGVKGKINGGTCLNQYNATTNPTGKSCDTQGFVTAVNAAGLCGATDWRMPSIRELDTLVDYNLYGAANAEGAGAIDNTWFPYTKGHGFWSSSANAGNSNQAWYLAFQDGYAMPTGNPNDPGSVRLVRGTTP
ncbi:MAG: DUF1566 domain-containing protein [Sulfuricella sp.]|nr:DUF1566 domain-containing protein [Sulfuricella sp.]